MIRISMLAAGAFAALFAVLPLSVSAQDKKDPKDQKAGGPPPGMPVRAVPVKVGTVLNEVSAVGSLIANESVIIRPETAGRIKAIQFDEGQTVARGAKLVLLDTSEIDAQLAGSSSDVRLQQARADRAEELFKKNFISQQALDDAREAFRKATARKAEDEVRLAKMEIRAPFSGIVGLRLVSPGAYVKVGEDLARLDAIDVIKLDFRIPEVFLGQVKKDQTVAVRVDAFPGQPFKGQVYALDTALDEKTRTATLRARIANPGGKLRPGMFARVALNLGSRDKALLIPEQALVPKGDKNYVFRVVDGKAQLAAVEIGSRNPGEVEIVKGLAAGDVVVTDGQMKLQDGVPVMVLPVAAKSAPTPAPPPAK
ncbi:MAG: efflux RND transporter periplasmic adaptor subunit [Burkholderiales bacterium]